MTLESDLFAVLSAVCPRTFPDVAPTTTAKPYVTYQQIGGDVINLLDNTPSGKRNALMQIDVWADTRAEANALILQIEDALRTAAAFMSVPQGALHGDYDHDMKVYGSKQDFSIWQ